MDQRESSSYIWVSLQKRGFQIIINSTDIKTSNLQVGPHEFKKKLLYSKQHKIQIKRPAEWENFLTAIHLADISRTYKELRNLSIKKTKITILEMCTKPDFSKDEMCITEKHF